VADLKGKVAIVTGAGRGIGRAHALTLAREGAAVLVNDLGGEFSGDGNASSGPADEVVRNIVAFGGRAMADTTDISDWDQAAGLVDAALKTFGRLDIVVNNAGIARFGTIDRVSRHDWERTIAVNLTGTAALCHWAAAHWRTQGPEAGRRIVNTSSAVGLEPHPNNPMYVASKAGVAALTIACAIELAELGVRVNALAPVARTRISEFVVGPSMKTIPAGFDPMSPDHPAAVVAYLASPSCRFTGRVLGIVGDNLTIYDGWSVGHYVGNASQGWTLDSLRRALADVPSQHRGKTQAMMGVDDLLTPPDAALEALVAIETA
jgi:NAD(P)-dependent dehydrogenase (short-subunit alcohol dehydrogenase family)